MSFDERQVADYLSSQLSAPVVVRSLHRTFPGNSRETWIVQCEVSQRPDGFVLRVEPPEGSGGPAPLKQEWEVYRRLWGTEVPVAEPLWYDEGKEFAEGRALMVRRLAEGSTTVAGLWDGGAESEALRKRVAHQCVEKLATVHRLDWKAAGLDTILPPPPSAAESYRFEFDIWRGHWDRLRCEPDPVLEELLCWLEEHIPDDTPRISLVKGNNGLGEEIWQEDRIVAMSDWELAMLGDGLSDLFWSQGTVKLSGFDDVLAHYERCMDQKISPQRLGYAGVFSYAKMFICGLVFFYRKYYEGKTDRIFSTGMLSYSYEIRHRLGRCIGKSIEEAFDIVNSGNEGLYTRMGGSKK